MVLTILSVEVAILAVTGIALFFLYRPSASQAWSDLVTETNAWDVRLAYGLRLIHRVTSQLAIPTAIAAGVLVALRNQVGVPHWHGPATGAGTAITTLLASFTGFLLPWDQLALSAVRVGSSIRGYPPLFGPEVRFVIMGGVEISA
ncbi:MAG: cytochrome b N-terminal domain-containing protein, partial [Actinobacteria bacterium]|nr:cytochrome b N-terminal domain-containing protein [Actinomycetota bacterium]